MGNAMVEVEVGRFIRSPYAWCGEVNGFLLAEAVTSSILISNSAQVEPRCSLS